MLKFKNLKKKNIIIIIWSNYPLDLPRALYIFFFLREREFEPMASAPDDSSLSLDQDTNQFLV